MSTTFMSPFFQWLAKKIVAKVGSKTLQKLYDELVGGGLITEEEEQKLLEEYYQSGDRDRSIDPYRSNFTTASTTAVPVRRDPAIVDLDGDGIETTNVKDGAFFDHDGNGFAEQTALAAPDDGTLVMDRDGNGTIDSGKELFGDQTILNNGQRAANGLQALREQDSNADGKIDANDTAFANLKVWQDIDGDGYKDIIATVIDNDYYCGKFGADCEFRVFVAKTQGGFRQITSCMSIFHARPVYILNEKANGLRKIIVSDKFILEFNGKEYCNEK
ncbi:MAG: hypothetical protein M1406_02010 [Nitrospirae bacterium]|nr:hypothetical protein [Nitrospirota bacterium]